jgi:hypothetical protein
MPDSGLLDAAAAPDVVVRLNTLEHALKSLEKRTIGEGAKIGRFLFQSQEDLRLWMVTHVPSNRFGLFLDAVSIFDFLAQPHMDTQENMSQLYNSQKNALRPPMSLESFLLCRTFFLTCLERHLLME